MTWVTEIGDWRSEWAEVGCEYGWSGSRHGSRRLEIEVGWSGLWYGWNGSRRGQCFWVSVVRLGFCWRVCCCWVFVVTLVFFFFFFLIWNFCFGGILEELLCTCRRNQLIAMSTNRIASGYLGLLSCGCSEKYFYIIFILLYIIGENTILESRLIWSLHFSSSQFSPCYF